MFSPYYTYIWLPDNIMFLILLPDRSFISKRQNDRRINDFSYARNTHKASHNTDSNVKICGGHWSILLQVISIVPAITASSYGQARGSSSKSQIPRIHHMFLYPKMITSWSLQTNCNLGNSSMLRRWRPGLLFQFSWGLGRFLEEIHALVTPRI